VNLAAGYWLLAAGYRETNIMTKNRYVKALVGEDFHPVKKARRQ
jgi:hypothetical protein